MTSPKEYQNFYSAKDSNPSTSKTLKNITNRLLIEESGIQRIKGEVSDQKISSGISS